MIVGHDSWPLFHNFYAKHLVKLRFKLIKQEKYRLIKTWIIKYSRQFSAYSTNGAESELDPYSWQEENPYKKMNTGAAKNNGNKKRDPENNPLDHLAKCAEVELTKIAADNENANKALQAR